MNHRLVFAFSFEFSLGPSQTAVSFQLDPQMKHDIEPHFDF